MLLPIHERELTPFTKAPSKDLKAPIVGIGRGSSNAARRAQMELSSRVCKHQNRHKGTAISKINYHCDNFRTHVLRSSAETFICLVSKGKPDDESKRFAHFPVAEGH